MESCQRRHLSVPVRQRRYHYRIPADSAFNLEAANQINEDKRVLALVVSLELNDLRLCLRGAAEYLD